MTLDRETLARGGWAVRGEPGDVNETTAATVGTVLAAERATRLKACEITDRRVFATTRGLCLGVSAGRAQAGVHVEDGTGRMELYLTRNDSEPGVRLRVEADVELATKMLTAPPASRITGHDSFTTVRAEEVPEPGTDAA